MLQINLKDKEVLDEHEWVGRDAVQEKTRH